MYSMGNEIEILFVTELEVVDLLVDGPWHRRRKKKMKKNIKKNGITDHESLLKEVNIHMVEI